MKKLLLLTALLCSFTASAQLSHTSDFFKEKNIDKSTFKGCLLQINHRGDTVNVPINSFLFSKNEDFYFSNGEGRMRLNIEDTNAQKELLDRYPYCSFHLPIPQN